jgi:hypothetical protein
MCNGDGVAIGCSPFMSARLCGGFSDSLNRQMKKTIMFACKIAATAGKKIHQKNIHD